MTLFASVGNLTPDAANIAMKAAEAEAVSNGWPVTICVSDSGGIPVHVKRTSPQTFPASYDVAVGKARTAALFCKETGLLEASVNVEGGSSRAALLSSPFVLMRGGVPFMVNGVCCGSVGVSGVTPEQDEQTAKAGINALVEAMKETS